MTASKNLRVYQIMEYTRVFYRDFKLSDAEFATKASEALGFEVKRASITQARKDLGIANNAPAAVDLKARVKELEELISGAVYELEEADSGDPVAQRLRAALEPRAKG